MLNSKTAPYNTLVAYILERATKEELDKFCNLTEKDYEAFRKHQLEQTLDDVSHETVNKFLKQIE